MHSESSYRLLAAFISAFGHKLRTPLSVISNELALGIQDTGAPSLSVRKCREITSLLNEARLEDLDRVRTEPVWPLELETLFRQQGFSIGTSPQVTQLLQKKRILKTALERLAAQLKALSSDPAELELRSAPAPETSPALQLSFKLRVAELRIKVPLHSWTELFCEALGQSNFTAPLIDAALQACRCETTIYCTTADELLATLIIPLLYDTCTSTPC